MLLLRLPLTHEQRVGGAGDVVQYLRAEQPPVIRQGSSGDFQINCGHLRQGEYFFQRKIFGPIHFLLVGLGVSLPIGNHWIK